MEFGILFTITFAMTWWTLFALYRQSRRPRRPVLWADEPWPSFLLPRSPRLVEGSAVPAQVLFSESQAQDLRIDFVLLRPAVVHGEHLPAGSPISLQLAKPTDPFLRTAVESVVGEWAAEERTVNVEFRGAYGEQRVRLSNAPTSIQLDLEDAA